MMKTLLTREGRIFLADNKKDFHSEFGFVAKKSMAGKRMVQKGSICLRGFNVSRPSM